MRSETLGEYYQDCFIIKCNIPIDFDNPVNSDTAAALGTFFHEYFHFLQNAMTTYGNFRMAIFYARMMNIYYQLERGIPIEKVKLDCEGIEVPAQQSDIALGDMDEWTYEEFDFIQIVDIKYQADESLGKYKDNVVPVIKLQIVKSRENKVKELNFGSMCMMESMADMLERNLYGKSRQKNYVQYEICELLWEYMLGESIPNWREKLFLSLEYSLMYDNPAQIFYFFLKYAEKICKEITDEDIYKFFTEKIKPNYVDTYENFYREMINKFNDIVNNSNSYTQHLNEYVVGMMKKFYHLRKKCPTIFTGLYKMQKDKCKKALTMIMKAGVPLILDKDNSIYSGIRYSNNSVGMEEYAAMYALYSMVGINREKGCVLKDLCIANKIEAVDENCDIKPLLHVKYEKLCLLGQLLYMWQIY